MKQDVTILVCCHKKDYYYSDDNFRPIQVGKDIAKTDLNIQGDNSGDNISAKNSSFCELTAHYWYWKNGLKTKYVGLNHYRRYFDFSKRHLYGIGGYSISDEYAAKNPPTLPDLDKLFNKYDIVLAKPLIYPYSLAKDYCICHIPEDFAILSDVVKKLYPEYYTAYTHVMDNTNKLSHYNMFITKYDIFEHYSKWLFDILFEVEKHVKISPYPSQARIFGYMSERLLNVYVYHHKLRIKYASVRKIATEEPYSTIWYSLSALKKNFIFRIDQL